MENYPATSWVDKTRLPKQDQKSHIGFKWTNPKTYTSSICENHLKNSKYSAEFHVDKYTVLSKSHSSFHLKVLESVYIKSHKSSLCKPGDCLLGLAILSW